MLTEEDYESFSKEVNIFAFPKKLTVYKAWRIFEFVLCERANKHIPRNKSVTHDSTKILTIQF